VVALRMDRHGGLSLQTLYSQGPMWGFSTAPTSGVVFKARVRPREKDFFNNPESIQVDPGIAVVA